MKFYVLLAAAFMLFAGCKRNFDDRLKEAESAYSSQRYVDAVDALNLALLRDKKSASDESLAQAYQLLGRSYDKLKKLTQAAEAYTQAIKLSKKYTYDSAYSLGIIRLTLKDYMNAKIAFERALERKPDDPLALLGLGDACFLLGDISTAERMYNRLLDTSPGTREALSNLKLIASKRAARTTTLSIRKPAPAKKPSRTKRRR